MTSTNSSSPPRRASSAAAGGPADAAPGWSQNPSSWSSRILLAALSAVGLLVSTYLTLYQLKVLHSVWEPIFGGGSRYVLRSSRLSRSLPFPDAALGALNYAADLVVGLPGPPDRWRRRPWQVLLLVPAVVPMAVVGVGLMILQGAVYHRFCTLCISSAALASVIVAVTMPEVLAACQHVVAAHRQGGSWRGAILGEGGR